jgi:hypothetical protein
MLVTITTKTGIIRRYEGKKRTHEAELMVPLSAEIMEDIFAFRAMPNARRFHEEVLTPPPPPPRAA